ncbi:RHS repeat-associated core domain-containing protein [Duganella sp. CF458]|uniref:RHS repeat-associated core domain-containing protein n=1 Tax=Duganella sp. CF458 TaxID=1884368 RepID=UPI0008E7C2F4|nr:RHS repeat-associated core domain-containing protein [Duganella sp. CF458]SFG28416.1 RHS repeat-associated core domain-containing protein [Duganella sp. CF458]
MKQMASIFFQAARLRGWLHALLIMLFGWGLLAQASAQTNNAQYLAQAVPTVMEAGQSYAVSVTMQNNGTSSWTAAAGYNLGSQNPQDNAQWGFGRVAPTVAVAPGQQHTFNFTVKAPASVGTYNFQWRMLREGVEWFGATAPNVAVSVVPVTPRNDAAFVSQLMPSSLTTGQTYSAKVVMKNTGNTTWLAGTDYLLGSQNPQDSSTWGLSRVIVGSNVPPGDSYIFNVPVKAPATAGTYNFQWRMVREFVTWFGATSTNVVVTVTQAAGAPTLTVSRNPSQLTAGQSYTLSWNSTNATSLSMQCTAAGTGYTATVNRPVNGSVTETASAAWVGYPSTCTWTATGAGGSKSVVETVTTVAQPASAPTISVSRNPSPMVAGKAYTLSWSSTNATAVSMSCTASGTGYAGTVNRAVSGSVNETASTAWVGYPSTCTWTATGAGGSKSVTETMSTVAQATDVVTYYHNDVSGSPMAATDASGNLLWKETYQPYGDKVHRQAASATNKIGFHGKPFDDNTGLSYMGARYYDPLLGRFTGIDPKSPDPENVHSINRYAYANNNPYKFVDPDGHSPVDVVFLAWDLGKLGMAMYTGVGVGAAVADVAMSSVGVLSPVPGVGQAMKAHRALEYGAQAAKGIDKAKDILAANKVAGKAGEAATRGKLGDNIIGEQVTFITSTGQRAKPDFLTKIDDKLGIVESKAGNAALSPGQAQLKADIKAGRAVTPVGKKAEAAGLTPGEKVKIESFKVDRYSR